jgi:two-component system phosphate regulon sensor histidine kinase PhoR
MHQGLHDEIRRIIFITLLALLAGLISGYLLYFLLLAGFLYSCWLLYQTRRFYLWLEQRMEAAPPDSGGIWGDIITTLHQIRQNNLAAQANLQQQLKRLQGLTSALQSGIVLLDSQGNIIWWNRSAEQLLGFKSNFDIGKPVVNLLRHPEFIKYYQVSNNDEPITISSPIDTNILQIQMTHYGKNEKLLSIHDVTRLKKLEQVRKDFVANVSHELRTPLTVINGYLEPLLDNIDGFDPDMQEALQKIQNQAKRMTNLVTDLATLSRLDNAERTDGQDTVNIIAMLQRISEEAKQIHKTKKIDITVEGDALLMTGSETELHSCFSNLVFNAVKYSKPERANIHIKTHVTDQEAIISIEDDGIGIDPGQIPRLTERFYRVDSSHSRKTGGSGLGLAIVKHVLHRHNGTLIIQSTIGRGSIFTCRFNKSQLVS